MGNLNVASKIIKNHKGFKNWKGQVIFWQLKSLRSIEKNNSSFLWSLYKGGTSKIP